MKKFGVALFVVALCLSLSAFGQYGSQQPNDQGSMSQDQNSTAGKKAGKPAHLKGKISDDGKTFTSDKDNKTYTIVNPEAVKGHEGHDVVLRAHVDPANNSVHVLSVKMAGERASKKKGNGTMSEQPPQ